MGIDEGVACDDDDVVGRVEDGVVVICAIEETEEVIDIADVATEGVLVGDKITEDTGVPKSDVG